MFICVDILFAALLGLLCSGIYRTRPPVLVRGICFHLAGMMAALLGALVSMPILKALLANLFLQWTLAAVLGLGAYIAGVWQLRKRLKEWQPVIKRPRVLQGACTTMVTMIWFLILITVVNILAARPDLYASIRDRSLYSRWFLVHDPMLHPNELGAVRPSMWNRMKQRITKGTGAHSVAETYRAVSFILTLEQHEYSFLGEHNEGLRNLKNHPVILEILTDKELVALFTRGEMGLGEVYGLGGNPKVKRLLEDESFREIVRQVDVVKMAEQVKHYRKSRRQSVPVRWQISAIDSTLELDGCLANAAQWTACDPTNIQWDTGKIGLAHTHLHYVGEIGVACRAKARPILLVNDESLKMTQSEDGRYAIRLPSDGGKPLDIVLMLDLSEAVRSCSIEVFCELP